MYVFVLCNDTFVLCPVPAFQVCTLMCSYLRELLHAGLEFYLLFLKCIFTCQQLYCDTCIQVFRWFKFTLKPPYTIMHGNLSSAIWDTSHWTSFVKFGLKTA